MHFEDCDFNEKLNKFFFKKGLEIAICMCYN